MALKIIGDGLKTSTMPSKIILIGPKLNKDLKTISGQSMMFQLLLDEVISKNINHCIVDISEQSEKTRVRKSGDLDFNRVLEYITVSFKFIKVVFFNPNSVIYLTVSQSTAGFLRDFYFISIGKLFSCKIVAHQFGGNFGNFYYNKNIVLRNFIKLTYRKVNKIIVEGDFSKSNFSFLNSNFKNVISLPNGLPEKELGLANFKNYRSGDKFQILYLSNLIISKGYLDVLSAINILINQRKIFVHCSFVGKFINAVDDPIDSDLTKCKSFFFEYISRNNLENFVSYSESKLGLDKQIEFQNAHLFILPSYYINEGQPVSVLEAISYGVVPLITNYRLMPQMINENSGMFVNKQDPECIADKIEFFINNPDVYNSFSKSSISHFNNNFTSEIYLEKLLKILQNEF